MTNTIIVLTYLCLAFPIFEGTFIYVHFILLTSQIVDIMNSILEMENMGHRKMGQPTQDHFSWQMIEASILQPFEEHWRHLLFAQNQ